MLIRWRLKRKKADRSKKKRLKDLEDEAAIRTLVAQFADTFIVSDVEEFKAFWVKEGKWTIQQPNFSSSEGIDEISEMFIKLKMKKDFFVQFAHSGVKQSLSEFSQEQ